MIKVAHTPEFDYTLRTMYISRRRLVIDWVSRGMYADRREELIQQRRDAGDGGAKT